MPKTKEAEKAKAAAVKAADKEAEKAKAAAVKAADKEAEKAKAAETSSDAPVAEPATAASAETEDEKNRRLRERPESRVVEAKPKPVKLDPLSPDQQYFEAPDGTVLVGEKSQSQIWYRQGNNGKGCWINPKR